MRFLLIKLTSVFSAIIMLGCSSSTKYQSVIGRPELVANRSILVDQIEGVENQRSHEVFLLFKKKLSRSFGSILFLPSSEYNLNIGGISRKQSKLVYEDMELRKKMFDHLNVDYLLNISLDDMATTKEQRNSFLNDRTVYRFKIFDKYSPSEISQFIIIVKTQKESISYFDPMTGLTYVRPKVSYNKEMMAMTRAAKEILKRRLYTNTSL